LWRSLQAVYQEVDAAVAQYRPDQLWVPAYEGGNPDHDGLNAVGFKFKGRISVLEFSEYNLFGGQAQSHIFVSSEPTAHIKLLTTEERANKRAAIAIYASEKNNLSSLSVVQESYRPLSLYDYALPPYQGPLWYARFRWVPFKHPRIDRTHAADVSNAITRFL
jgi:LmbE family N-acetylglucosaminyl deacetylase